MLDITVFLRINNCGVSSTLLDKPMNMPETTIFLVPFVPKFEKRLTNKLVENPRPNK